MGGSGFHRSCAVQHMVDVTCMGDILGDLNVIKYRFCGEGDSSFMAKLLLFLFSYKVADGSTKAEAASEIFALF